VLDRVLDLPALPSPPNWQIDENRFSTVTIGASLLGALLAATPAAAAAKKLPGTKVASPTQRSRASRPRSQGTSPTSTTSTSASTPVDRRARFTRCSPRT
jgi:hypothetical protein